MGGEASARMLLVKAEPASRAMSAVRRAQRGDREAVGYLYARYADDVYLYVRSILHDSHEAEDVTQQVFAKLMHAIVKYEEREVPFLAWILRVARNAAIDHVRSQRLVPVEDVRVNASGGDPAADRPLDDLREALFALPGDQREVVVLRHFGGLTPAQIAQRTGRSESSIHGLHHRGRKALKAFMTSRGSAPATASAVEVDASCAAARAAS